MSKKIVGIDGGKKGEPEACQFCGADPGHPMLLCPKVARIEMFDDGTLAAVEYFEPDKWQKHS